MIIKDKTSTEPSSSFNAAGDRQESAIAFYLRRAFNTHKSVFVFHDLNIKYGGEFAQIDHLILYRYGFILVESKSITGEVKVNPVGEWSRSYQGQWKGMPSPIKQVDLQADLLKVLLQANAKNLLRKFLNLLQERFGGRDWHTICAISSNAIIEREGIPKTISNRMVKSEFVVDKVLELMKLPSKAKQLTGGLMDSRPDFSDEEMERLCKFFVAVDKKTLKLKKATQVLNGPESKPAKKPHPVQPKSTEDVPVSASIQIACRECGDTKALDGRWGKYGYYVHCERCNANTSMKVFCPVCNSKEVKNRKEKDSFYLLCLSCHSEHHIHRNSGSM